MAGKRKGKQTPWQPPGTTPGFKFLHGRRPPPRTFPPDPDRDKKIAEFLAKRKKEAKSG
jgi:hypothetical protein